MDEETQKIIDEQLKRLPKDVKEAIISVDYKAKLQEIVKRQKLLIDQAGKLETETSLIMIGLEPLTDYINNLQKELNVSALRAKEISLDVSENIFKPIRDSLQMMNGALENPEEVNSPNYIPDTKETATKFTNTNEENLNRDQILNEIENPAIISGGNRAIEIKPTQKIELRQDLPQQIEIIPGEEVKNITPSLAKDINTDLVKTKMTETTMVSEQIVNNKPENKLPEVEKKKPTGGIDPYREAIS